MAKSAYRTEYARLAAGVITDPIREVIIFSVYLLCIGVYGFGTYKNGDPGAIRLMVTLMGMGLMTMIVGGTINAAVFFRAVRLLARNRHLKAAVQVKGNVAQHITDSTNQQSVARGIIAVIMVMIVGAVISVIAGRSRSALGRNNT